MNLDQIEQDLVWARDNADRSAQTRLYVHHVPQMLVRLRALEEDQAQGEEAPSVVVVKPEEQDVSDYPITPDEGFSEEASEPDVSVTVEEGLSDTETEADAQAEAVRNATPTEAVDVSALNEEQLAAALAEQRARRKASEEE